LPRAMSEDHTTVAEMQPQTSICADGDEAAPEGSSATQEAAEEAAAEPELEADADSSPVSLKVIFNKRKIDLTLPVSAKVISLKRQLQELTGVPVDMQKLMFRGLCHDDRRLSELGVGDGAKLMLVGSTPDSLASLPRAMSEDHTTVAEMQPQTSICADGDEAAPEGSSATQEAAEEAAAEPELEADADSSPVSLKVIFNKRKIDLTLPVSAKVISLKRQLQELTGVPVDMQKLMFRGLCHDDRRLSELGVGDGAKLMLVGSTPDSLASVRRQDAAGEAADARSKANNPGNSDGAGAVRLSQRDLHRRVLDKYGRPDDLTPGILNANLPLPPAPLSGMYNRQGAKVRLTFKLEIDQLWIGTKERTNKIPMSSIKRIVSEPIEGQEAHHIVGLQLGTTEQSMYWLYWVPCQYVRAIQTTIGT
uniref:Ubiquitin-like domain-containing protein n=2 Tax=Macrostomum lignano TaxID=282301 RepID=A0A1I8GM76_9PLAT